METPLSSIVSTGDLGGQKVKMSFDENSLAHLMSVLTDLYSDPVGAVIREYSTNALDAHIEAGVTDPIEVFTPNKLSPFFRVVDHGVGLSPDDICEIYSKYGASTKRGTNDQVGMLGLGAKSALTLVPQFTLTAVKNGVKTLVSVSRAADGSGQMEIVDTSSTTERNGVEISLPIQRSYDFIGKCKHFFQFWEAGTVLLDGAVPTPLKGRQVGDSFVVDGSLMSDYVVMGNVAYPVPDGIYRPGYSYQNLGIVARVPIGSVNFTPSREALQFTAQTKKTLSELKTKFASEITKAAQAAVANAANHTEAWKEATYWKNNFSLRDFVYKGKAVPTGNMDIMKFKYYDIVGSGRWNGYMYVVDYKTADEVLFVTNFAESLKLSPIQRQKVEKYCLDNGYSFKKVAIRSDDTVANPDAPMDPVWIANLTVVPWPEINKIKIDRPKGVNVKRSEPYDMVDKDDGWATIPTSTFDQTKPIVYLSSAEVKRASWLYQMLPDGAQVVSINKNRWDKFKRDWPTAVHYRKAITDRQAFLVSQLTDSDKILWHYSDRSRNVSGFDPSKIEDEKAAEFIKVLLDGKFSDAALKLKNLQRNVDGFPRPVVDTPENPLTRYPMFDTLRYVHDTEHNYWYLNSYYNKFIKEHN